MTSVSRCVRLVAMPNPKPKVVIISVFAAIVAAAMFIWADHKLAPPYPVAPTNAVSGVESTEVFGETTSTNVIFTK